MSRETIPAQWSVKGGLGLPSGIEQLCTFKDQDGTWHYSFYFDESHCNVQGNVHGGTLMTALDHGLALVIWEATARSFCSTIQLDNHFFTAVKPGSFVELKTTITKQARHLVFATGELWHGSELVVRATGVWQVKRKDIASE